MVVSRMAFEQGVGPLTDVRGWNGAWRSKRVVGRRARFGRRGRAQRGTHVFGADAGLMMVVSRMAFEQGVGPLTHVRGWNGAWRSNRVVGRRARFGRRGGPQRGTHVFGGDAGLTMVVSRMAFEQGVGPLTDVRGWNGAWRSKRVVGRRARFGRRGDAQRGTHVFGADAGLMMVVSRMAFEQGVGPLTHVRGWNGAWRSNRVVGCRARFGRRGGPQRGTQVFGGRAGLGRMPSCPAWMVGQPQ